MDQRKPERVSTSWFLVLVVSGIAAFASACETKQIPQSMVGSYVRSEPTMMGLMRQTANLEVTTTGITARSGGMSSEIAVGPNGPQGRITQSASSSVLFKSVSCTNASTCKFVGSDGRCDGTITRDDDGDVTIIATGLCANPLAGKWLGPKNAASVVPSGPQFH